MQEVEIIPSLLSADFAILAEEIKKVEKAGCRRLHLDVMDGHFVPNITIGPVIVKAIRKETKLYLQAHLMIEEPDKFVKDFNEAGADAIIIHQEACSNFLKAIKDIKKLGLDAGIALRPKTPVKSIRDVIQQVDMVLIMTVEPGFGGQKFIKGTEGKVKETKALLEEKKLDIPIGVDGGINKDTIREVVDAGASHIIAGNAVFSGDVAENIKHLYKSIHK